MEQKKKRDAELAIPSEPSRTCPLQKPDCIGDACAFWQELEDWKGCGLRLVEAAIKEFMGEGARWLDDLLGLSGKGPK